MSGGGGKGGSQTQKTELPDWLSKAAEAAVGQGQDIGKIGYVPSYGPDVAAMNPLQMGAMRNTQGAAGAFGMQGGGVNSLPPAETFAGGVRGYSSHGLLQENMDRLKQERPGQYQFMQDFFIDPITGEEGSRADPMNQIADSYTPTGFPGAYKSPTDAGLSPLYQNQDGQFVTYEPISPTPPMGDARARMFRNGKGLL